MTVGRTREANRYKYNEEHFEDFRIHLDVEEEGFQVITTKIIVDESKDEILDPDREISLDEIHRSFTAAARLTQARLVLGVLVF